MLGFGSVGRERVIDDGLVLKVVHSSEVDD